MITPREYVDAMEELGYRLYVIPEMATRFSYYEQVPWHRGPGDCEVDLALRARARAVPGFNTRLAEYLTTHRQYRPDA